MERRGDKRACFLLNVKGQRPPHFIVALYILYTTCVFTLTWMSRVIFWIFACDPGCSMTLSAAFPAEIAQNPNPSCVLWRRARGDDSISGQPQLFSFLILIDLDLFFCFAVMKKWEVPRDWKILSALARSNSHTPKLGPFYKIYCLKLSKNKKFKRPGCFNALQWIIKKCAIPDNGEGNFNTFGCKFTEETHWHIFAWRSYTTLSCIFISVSKEMVKYSSCVSHPESGLMLNTENERHHFSKNRNLYKWDTCSSGSCTKTQAGAALGRLIHIHRYSGVQPSIKGLIDRLISSIWDNQ